MRSVWFAFVAILGASLLGAFLLWRALDTSNPAEKVLAPRGARVIEQRPLGTGRIVTWRLGGHEEEPSTGLYGITVWQGDRRLYEHRAAPNMTGIHVETGDFTGDGRSDALLFEDHDGSGGCGVYRALVSTTATFRQVSSRLLCVDQGSIHLRDGGLVFRLGVSKDPKTASQIHCCFEFVRTTVKRWNGQRLVVVSSSRQRLQAGRNWPPGGYPPA
jgi:hypothetical protein